MARKAKVIEEIKSDIFKLNLKEGDVLVLRGEFTPNELRSICAMPNVPRVPVVIIKDGQEITVRSK